MTVIKENSVKTKSAGRTVIVEFAVPVIGGSLSFNLAEEDLYIRDMIEVYGVSNTYMLCIFFMSWLSLLSDSPRGLKRSIELEKFATMFLSKPLEIIDQYNVLAHTLITSCVSDETGPRVALSLTTDFKGTPVFQEALAVVRERDRTTFQYLFTFLSFGKKLYFEDETLAPKALSEWEATEDRLAAHVVPPWVENLKPIISWLLQTPEDITVPEFIVPKHGPGAVAESGVRGIWHKNDALVWTDYMNYLVRPRDSYEGYIRPVMPTTARHVNKDEINVSNRAVIIDVPKTHNKRRLICEMPIAKMFLQQGVMNYFYLLMRYSNARYFVDMKDQERSHDLTKFGSATGLVDTVDSKAASDSILWVIIQKIFENKYLKWMTACRVSEALLPTGETRSMVKYAPMGDALCFPVQTLFFTAVSILAAYSLVYERSWQDSVFWDGITLDGSIFSFRYKSKVQKKILAPRVYGDDVISDMRTTSSIIAMLNDLGVEVNEEKSFIGLRTTFRESCGIFCKEGEDVTPLRFKVKSLSKRLSGETVASLIDFTNRAGEYGYTTVRRNLTSYILNVDIKGLPKSSSQRSRKNPILFSSNKDDSFAFYSDMPNNTHLSTSYNEDLQYWGYNHIHLEPGLSLEKLVENPPSIKNTDMKALRQDCKALVSRKWDNQSWYYYNVWWHVRNDDTVKRRQKLEESVPSRSTVYWDQKLRFPSTMLRYVDSIKLNTATVYSEDPISAGKVGWKWTPIHRVE